MPSENTLLSDNYLHHVKIFTQNVNYSPEVAFVFLTVGVLAWKLNASVIMMVTDDNVFLCFSVLLYVLIELKCGQELVVPYTDQQEVS